MEIRPDTPVTQFPGVGPARAAALERLGLRTASDLVHFYPRDYEDRREIFPIRRAPLDRKVCVTGLVAHTPVLTRVRKGMELVKVTVVDGSGTVYLTFFNQSYVKNALHAGESVTLYGLMEEQGSRRSMINPVFEPEGAGRATGRIVPVYPLTAGITGHLLSGLIARAVDALADGLEESLPSWVREEYRLMPIGAAVRAAHAPVDFPGLARARERLCFEELFYLSAGLELLRARRTRYAQGLPMGGGNPEEFAALLPFSPTAAQLRAMGEVGADMALNRPMNRLVQGDVGSGKTVVAAYGAWLAGQNGCQCALMAPTEVLAQQHQRTLAPLLGQAGLRVGLLTSALGAGEKREVRRRLAQGELDVVVGTHALLSQGVEFARLGLVITDEQHRFGVGQRSALAGKSHLEGELHPHVLVMSATPIPRTLALIIYGDLEVSIIDQLPPGRTPVETYVVGESKRERVYGFVRRLVAEGRQAYIVCPAVEEAESGQGAPLKAVTSYVEQLRREVFPQLRLAMLHGRMRPKEKEAVMSAFSRGEIDVLVSTTVIEVGVDVPNAALMVVENAERFGLSQLHQLRGRVGRGSHRSYCVLLTAARGGDTMDRLKALASTTDGFKIAEEDLLLRGPGDFFGSRQHGLPQLHMADLAADTRLLSQAQQAARQLLEGDPALADPANAPVLARVKHLFCDTPDIFN